MGKFCSGHRFQQHARQVLQATGAAGGISERAGLGLGECDELLDVIRRHRGIHHQHVGLIGGMRDRRKIGDRVEGLLVKQVNAGGLAAGEHQQGVAIRRRARGDL